MELELILEGGKWVVWNKGKNFTKEFFIEFNDYQAAIDFTVKFLSGAPE